MVAEHALARLETATRLLAEAKTVDEVRDIRNLAEAARVYARERDLGIEAINHAAEIKLRAERRLGDLLAEMSKNEGGRPPENRSHDVTGLPLTLADLGIGKMESHRWQQVASVPEPVFEQHVAETKAAGEPLTTAGVARLAQAGKQVELLICPACGREHLVREFNQRCPYCHSYEPPVSADEYHLPHPSARLSVHFSSETDEWYTPTSIIERTVRLLDEIDLDPCSNQGVPNVPAGTYYTESDNGLSRQWQGRVYMNPPYGRVIGDWVSKLYRDYQLGSVSEAIALVPARTDTEWFRLLRDTAICFINGRLKFSGQENSAPFPSCVAYLGKNRTGFTRCFADIGDIWIRVDD